MTALPHLTTLFHTFSTLHHTPQKHLPNPHHHTLLKGCGGVVWCGLGCGGWIATHHTSPHFGEFK